MSTLLRPGLRTRRAFLQQAGMAAAASSLPPLLHSQPEAPSATNIRLEIAPFKLQVSARREIDTVAYNGQVPGPLYRLRAGEPVDVEIINRTAVPEIVHWHGLFLPSALDGAMEEGSPMIAPGARTQFRIVPRPAGFRWYHTHTFANGNFHRGQYTGQHGTLLIEGKDEPGDFDAEAVLTLHDWEGHLTGSDDGSMNPGYDVSTINGRTLGFGDPLRVRQGQRLRLHIVNTSATEIHWIALAGHQFHVIALDGNAVPIPTSVPMLRLGPAERVTATVAMDNPGIWVLGEVRRHIREAGMGLVVEYAGVTGSPQWNQPQSLAWSYLPFAATAPAEQTHEATPIDLVFRSKFHGHGSEESWTINGKSYPDVDLPRLVAGQRYRLRMKNESMDDHPMHLHRHSFELRYVEDKPTNGLIKDVVWVPSAKTCEAEFTANAPGPTLFHCHQQNHMDRGFMGVFQYA